MSKYKKALSIVFKGLIITFALIGVFLLTAYFAIYKQWTNDSGSVDINNRKFQEVSRLEINDSNQDKANNAIQPHNAAFITYKIMLLSKFYPENAQKIMELLEQTGDFKLANKMIEAVSITTSDSVNLGSEFMNKKDMFYDFSGLNSKGKNVFEWVDLEEWKALKMAILKDKLLIDSVGNMLGIEPRLITMVLIGEQIRLFNSEREVYKRALLPLKILSVSNMISFGVTGIKEFTAKDVENNLKDSSSQFYLGNYYKNILKFKTSDPSTERMAKLIDYKNHFYSYLYAGLIICQIREQWRRAGFDISNRPEILSTLFNVGFRYSKPKSNPVVGGSRIKIGEKNYTFGGIGFEFYYSGEMLNEFPYKKDGKFNLKSM